MKQPTINEQLVRRYLLGELPRRERERLEVSLLTDDRYYEAISALENEVEDELIDEYLDGQMTGTELENFERVFLQTPERVHKLKVLKVLKEQAVSAAQPEPVPAKNVTPNRSSHRWIPALTLFRTPQFGFACAAALVLVLPGGIWLWVKSNRLETQLQQARLQNSTDSALRDRVAALSRNNEDLTARLKSSEEQRAGLERDLASLKGPEVTQPDKPRTTFASLTLLPGLRSSSGNSNSILTLQPEHTEARLFLNVERVDPKDYKRFRAIVKKQSGSEVWRNENVKLHASGNNARAILIIPAAMLENGQYIGELDGLTSDEQPSLLGLYVFRVVRK